MLGYLYPRNTVCVCVCVACVNWSFDIIYEREDLSFHILWGSINCCIMIMIVTILAAYMYNGGFIGWPFLAMCKPLFTSF